MVNENYFIQKVSMFFIELIKTDLFFDPVFYPRFYRYFQRNAVFIENISKFDYKYIYLIKKLYF
jgi:hypothetical protein